MTIYKYKIPMVKTNRNTVINGTVYQSRENICNIYNRKSIFLMCKGLLGSNKQKGYKNRKMNQRTYNLPE